MKLVEWRTLDKREQLQLLNRPAMESSQELQDTVASIIEQVRHEGDDALLSLGQRFDGQRPVALLTPKEDLARAADELPTEARQAIDRAMETVRRFHEAGIPQNYTVETAVGVSCHARFLPLDPVGLYVPAGLAPLPSTAIMLGIPARLAGCQQIVLATPPGEDGRANAAVRAIAHHLGIDSVLVAGGAQAVAAMAYGTQSVPACVKIFGPGNRFVTEAKRQVAQSADGAMMDLPAGPSELMVIADRTAVPSFVAVDLLSQAEHGPDSQVFLVTDDRKLALDVEQAVNEYLGDLPRRTIAQKALEHGAMILVEQFDQAMDIANAYAPEHLIIATDNATAQSQQITRAGSVFLGHFTPESLGDYISGTNHVLPTGGWAKALSGLSVGDFMRRMTMQEATPEGLAELGPPGAALAQHEGLDAHALAVTLRLAKLKQEPST